MKKKKRYQVTVLYSHEDYMNEKIEALQDEGWEMCGHILVSNKSGWCGDTHVFIPFRREVKKNG
jgi:hypothetical protein